MADFQCEEECIQKLRDGGFTVRCFTMGDLKRVGGYFKSAGVDLPAEHLMSCDSAGVGKPDPAAYRPILEELSKDGSQPWFAAAHCKCNTSMPSEESKILTLSFL